MSGTRESSEAWCFLQLLLRWDYNLSSLVFLNQLGAEFSFSAPSARPSTYTFGLMGRS
jgi:hypothetical protein